MSVQRKHVVLAGDSIFDNDGYVRSGEPGVIEQLRRSMPTGWSAYKIAVDGDCIRDVSAQLGELPAQTTDLVLSVGGNDMIGHSHLMGQVRELSDLPDILDAAKADFACQYGALIERLCALPMRIMVCTVYTAIPFKELQFRAFAPAAIAAFNDVIAEEAGRRGIPVLRLEAICTEHGDFSEHSPIEPSAAGGQKIVDALLRHLQAA